MFIKYIKIENWKCFSRRDIKFKNQNIINWANGEGKTSIFQAILFCLFGKRPPGFTFRSLRLDPTKDCKLEVSFEYENQNDEIIDIIVRRQFNNNSSMVAVLQNGEIICSTLNSAFEFINNILPYDIISVLWSPGTLQSSEILNPDFLVKSLFNHIFRDPKNIEKHFKYEVYSINRTLNSISNSISGSSSEILKKLKENEKAIKDIKSKIKDRSTSSNSQLIKAKAAEQASKEIEKIKVEKEIPLNICEEYLRLVNNKDIKELKSKIKEDLKKEKDKKSSAIDNIPPAIINLILKESEKGNCIICNNEWKKSFSENIKETIKKGKVDIKKIDLLTKQLDLLKYKEKDIRDNLQYNKLSSTVKSCPNFKEIIDNYDEENNNLWKELEELESESKMLNKELENHSLYIKEKKKFEEAKKKLSIPQEYITKASSYYSHTMTENASEILCSLNSEYDQIFLDEDEKEYKITKIDERENTINLLSAVQLSGGERTLIGISLILSAHSLFFPNIPLLFDESFSALDRENISALKSYFKAQNFQTFIITHDKYWMLED